jgi:hypothetical protein
MSQELSELGYAPPQAPVACERSDCDEERCAWNRYTRLLEQNPSENKCGTVRQSEMSGARHPCVLRARATTTRARSDPLSTGSAMSVTLARRYLLPNLRNARIDLAACGTAA